jgi:hypothetical protein
MLNPLIRTLVKVAVASLIVGTILSHFGITAEQLIKEFGPSYERVEDVARRGHFVGCPESACRRDGDPASVVSAVPVPAARRQRPEAGLGRLSHRRVQARYAVHEPEQRSLPERPVQFPRPDVRVSLPEPEAVLSPAATETRTLPPDETRPLNLTRFGWLTTPLWIWTRKL